MLEHLLGHLRRLAVASAGVLAAAGALAAAPAVAAPETILQDDAVLLHSDDDGVRQAVAQLRDLGIDRVRVTAGWSVLAPNADSATPPSNFDATDPAAYPANIWRNLDRVVRDAHAAGLKVDIDIAFWAPRWATKEPASATDRMRTEIDPQMYAQFAQAVARRYGGSYTPPAPPSNAPPPSNNNNNPPPPSSNPNPNGGGASPPPTAPVANPFGQLLGGYHSNSEAGPLPAVDMFTIWNEPNQPGFMMPQWKQENGAWVVASADEYRAMLQAAYPVIKAAAPSAKVLIGGTASMGSNHIGTGSVAPLRFLRRLACVDDNLQPITTGGCANFQSLPGDGWAHHPYSLLWRPNYVPRNPDMAPVGATFRLTSTLRRLADEGRISGADADVYMTEYGYGTNPPDPMAPFSLGDQVTNLAWAESLALRDQAVKSWPQFLLRDRPDGPAGPQMRMFGDWHTGLFFNDGSPKPVAATFRVPTFAQCIISGKQRYTMIWARLRGAGPATSTIQFSGNGRDWQDKATAASLRRHAATAAAAPTADGVITRWVPYRPHETYRVVWNAARIGTFAAAATKPLACGSADASYARAHRRTRAHARRLQVRARTRG